MKIEKGLVEEEKSSFFPQVNISSLSRFRRFNGRPLNLSAGSAPGIRARSPPRDRRGLCRPPPARPVGPVYRRHPVHSVAGCMPIVYLHPSARPLYLYLSPGWKFAWHLHPIAAQRRLKAASTVVIVAVAGDGKRTGEGETEGVDRSPALPFATTEGQGRVGALIRRN